MHCHIFPVAISEGSHPFPSRTRKLSPPEPMVLRGKPRGRVGRCRIFSIDGRQSLSRGWRPSPLRATTSSSPRVAARTPGAAGARSCALPLSADTASDAWRPAEADALRPASSDPGGRGSPAVLGRGTPPVACDGNGFGHDTAPTRRCATRPVTFTTENLAAGALAPRCSPESLVYCSAAPVRPVGPSPVRGGSLQSRHVGGGTP